MRKFLEVFSIVTFALSVSVACLAATILIGMTWGPLFAVPLIIVVLSAIIAAAAVWG